MLVNFVLLLLLLCFQNNIYGFINHLFLNVVPTTRTLTLTHASHENDDISDLGRSGDENIDDNGCDRKNRPFQSFQLNGFTLVRVYYTLITRSLLKLPTNYQIISKVISRIDGIGRCTSVNTLTRREKIWST